MENEWEELDFLWLKYVGSYHMFEGDEVAIIRRLYKGRVLKVRQINQLYYKTKYWRRIRFKVLRRDGFSCVRCGSQMSLHVDHLRYGDMGEENLDDLQTLCWHCHVLKTKKYDMFAGKDLPKEKVDLSGDHLYMAMRRRGLYGTAAKGGGRVHAEKIRGDTSVAVESAE